MTPVQVLVIASAVISTAGNTAIWREAWRRDARPVAASWLEWAALMGTGAVASAQAGQLPAAVYGGFCAAGCAVVVPITLIRVPAGDRDPPARIGGARLDVLLLPACLAGLMLLATSMTTVGHGWIRTPGPAVAVSVATDALAYLPTIMHAWQQPRHEPWTVYGLFGAGAALTLAAVALQGQMLDLTAAAYPLYLTAADIGVAVMITARLRAVPSSRPAQVPPWPSVQVAGGAGENRPLAALTEPERRRAVTAVVGLLGQDLELHH